MNQGAVQSNNSSSKALKVFLKLLAVLLLSGAAGIGFLTAVYCLPTDRILRHAGSGSEIIMKETSEFQYSDGYVTTVLDNWTDALMLAKAADSTGDPLMDAVLVPNKSYSDAPESMDLFTELNGDGDYTGIETYARYWHGYLVLLKPILWVFDYSDVIVLNQMLQLLLILTVFFLLGRRNLNEYLLPFVAMIIIWNPATTGVSLQFSACFYVSLGISAILLAFPNHGTDSSTGDASLKTLMTFMVSGILTSFLDILTYPVATLGVPLVIWLVLHRKEIRHWFRNTVLICIVWAAGYLGMWAEKWFYGSAISGVNIIADAFMNIQSRTSTENGTQKFSRIGTIITLVEYTFAKWPYLILMLAAVLCILVVRRKYHIYGDRKAAAILFLVGLLPFCWYLMATNHSALHPRLVYRDMCVTVIAWLSCLLNIEVRSRKTVQNPLQQTGSSKE